MLWKMQPQGTKTHLEAHGQTLMNKFLRLVVSEWDSSLYVSLGHQQMTKSKPDDTEKVCSFSRS